jgi:hypothetical protein
MTPFPNHLPTKPLLPFNTWKLQLRRDCELRDKLLAFDAVEEHVLKLLWATGVHPTVKAILEYPGWNKPESRHG